MCDNWNEYASVRWAELTKQRGCSGMREGELWGGNGSVGWVALHNTQPTTLEYLSTIRFDKVLTMFHAFQLLQWLNFSYIFQENWKFTRRVVLQNTPNLYTGVLCTFKLYYFVKPKCVESILLHIQCLIYFADVKHSEEEGDSVRGKSAFSLSEIRRDCCSGVQSV